MNKQAYGGLAEIRGNAAELVEEPPRVTDTFRWRLAIGAVLILGGYAAWMLIPIVVGSGTKARPAVTNALML